MNTITKGRIGEAAVVAHFIKNEYEVFLPAFGNSTIDLIIYKNEIYSRVEVKTCSNLIGDSYQVLLRSVRHNTTSSTIKKFDGKASDILAVYLVDEDRIVSFNSIELDGRSTINIRKVNPIGDGTDLENRRALVEP